MRTQQTALCTIASLFFALRFQAQATMGQVFTDDFNRPDSPSVGNGWSDLVGNVGGDIGISGNKASAPNPTANSDSTGIYRPFPFTTPVTITATLYEENGFGGLLRRYGSSLAIANDGVLDHGYGVSFARGDETFNDSRISLFDGTNTLGTVFVNNQFGSSIDVTFTINLDGSVAGNVNGIENFSFGPHPILSGGSSFAYWAGFADSRATSFTNPRIDDLTVAAIPEPTSLFAVGPFAFLLRRRK